MFLATHVYYDIDIYHVDNDGTAPPKQLQFQELRNYPFLDDPELYHMSIVRFHLGTGTLPVFISQIQTGQPDPNLTVYKITVFVQQGSPAHSSYVSFIPPNPNVPVVPPTYQQDVGSEYYYCLTCQSFIDNLNQTLLSIFNEIYPNNPAVAPFFTWDGQSMTASFTISTTFTASFLIYFNRPLMKLFKSFPASLNSYNDPDGLNWQLAFKLNPDLSNQVTENAASSSFPAIQITQEQSTISLWNPIKSIVFTTSLLPVAPNLIGIPSDNSLQLVSIGNNNNFSNILTDFVVPVSPGNGYNPCIDYNPSSEYRLVDLRGASPLNSLDVAVYWKTP